MFKLFAVAATMLQVSQSVSLEHNQQIALLQDIETELPNISSRELETLIDKYRVERGRRGAVASREEAATEAE